MNHRFGLAITLATALFAVACTQETTAPAPPSSDGTKVEAPKPVADTVTVQDDTEDSTTDGGTGGRQMPNDP